MRTMLLALTMSLPVMAIVGCGGSGTPRDDGRVSERRQEGEKVFHRLSFEQALAKAKAEKKVVLADFSMPG